MSMTSRERLLRTIGGEPADHTPLCMFHFGALEERSANGRDFVQRQLDLGLDVLVELPRVSLRRHPDVTSEVWEEPLQPNPMLHKVYRTPAGDLTTVVEKTPDWPHGTEIPLITDFIIPRAKEFLVTEERDLEPLRFLLAPPDEEQIAQHCHAAEEMRGFADEQGLAVRDGFERLADMVCWLCGCEQFATMGLTDPSLLQGVLDVVSAWQEPRIAMLLKTKPDIVADGEWYSTTFLSPQLFDRFLAPAMKRRVDMVHEAGARFCMVATTNVMPFIENLKRLNIDVVFGVDPMQGGWDLPRAKAELGDSVCLYGGINGYLTIIDGSPEDVDRAVEQAMTVLAPGGRFILAPVDNVQIHQPSPPDAWQRTWSNVLRMVEAWKRLQ